MPLERPRLGRGIPSIPQAFATACEVCIVYFQRSLAPATITPPVHKTSRFKKSIGLIDRRINQRLSTVPEYGPMHRTQGRA
jgi:hypothetical protein